MTMRHASCHVPVLLLGVTVATAAMCARDAEAQCQYEVIQLDYPINCGIGSVITIGAGLNNQGIVLTAPWATWPRGSSLHQRART